MRARWHLHVCPSHEMLKPKPMQSNNCDTDSPDLNTLVFNPQYLSRQSTDGERRNRVLPIVLLLALRPNNGSMVPCPVSKFKPCRAKHRQIREDVHESS